MSDTMKPCPFCGCQALLTTETQYRAYVRCASMSCGCGTGMCGGSDSREIAIAAWNRRAPSPEVERLVELQREAENKRRALESLKKENKALKEKLAPITHRDRDFKELKNEIENLREMVKDSAKHLAYALDYGPEDAIDNTLHAGCRDRALAHLRTLAAYKEAQR